MSFNASDTGGIPSSGDKFANFSLPDLLPGQFKLSSQAALAQAVSALCRDGDHGHRHLRGY